MNRYRAGRAATTLPLLVVLLLAGLGGAFSLWSQDLGMDVTVDTGELDWEIINNSWNTNDPCAINGNPVTSNDFNLFPQGTPPFSAPYDWSGQSPVLMDKDVGCTEIIPHDSDSDGDIDMLEFNIYNTYPFYYAQLTFDVRNNGSVPIIISTVAYDVGCDGTIDYGPFTEINQNIVEDQGVDLDFDNDGIGEVKIWWGNNFGVQLHTNEDAALGMDLVVLQEADEGQTYNFCVYIDAVQWNEYSP